MPVEAPDLVSQYESQQSAAPDLVAQFEQDQKPLTRAQADQQIEDSATLGMGKWHPSASGPSFAQTHYTTASGDEPDLQDVRGQKRPVMLDQSRGAFRADQNYRSAHPEVEQAEYNAWKLDPSVPFAERLRRRAGGRERQITEETNEMNADNEKWLQTAGNFGADQGENLLRLRMPEGEKPSPEAIGSFRSAGRFAATFVADPVNYATAPLGGVGGKAGQLAMSAGFSIPAGKSAYDAFHELNTRTDLTPEQRAELRTDALLNTMFAGMAAKHFVHGAVTPGPMFSASPEAHIMAQAQADDTMAQRVGLGLPPVNPQPKPPSPFQMIGPVMGRHDVEAITHVVSEAPEARRDQLISQAHAGLTQWIGENNGRVVVDGKVHIAKTPEQAETLAQKIINDAVAVHDKQQAAISEQQSATQKKEGHPLDQFLSKTRQARVQKPASQEATLEAPVSGMPPADKNLTTDTAAVQRVMEQADIHPEQQPAVMVKEEPPKEAAALAEPPKPVNPDEAAKVGKDDKESGRTVLQPSGDVMQNERMAGEAAPELATKLSHIAAGVEGATFDRLRPQKELERIDEKVDKADKPPETVPDYLAAQIAADTPQAKDQLIASLQREFRVVKVEDNFLEGKKELANYRSANVQVQMQNGSTAEVQIVPREQQEIANESHKYYTAGREAELRGDTTERDKQFAVAAKMHDEAMAKFNERNGIEQTESVPLEELEKQPIYEMGRDELESAEKADKAKDDSMLEEFFGAEGAKKYKRLQRVANSTMRSFKETDEASDELGRMESALTQEQQNRLYGVGENGPTHEDFRDFRNALGQIDGETPQELGESLRWAVTKLGDADLKNPAGMKQEQQIAYAQIRHGFQQAAEQGFDPNEVWKAALKGAAGRFSDPNDAAFMLKRFAKPPAQTETQPVAPQLPAPERRSNLTERKRVEHMTPEERGHHLLHSELTGLPNKRAFEEDSKRMAESHPHVGFADVDDFKPFNTILGEDNVDQKVLPVIGDAFQRAAAKEPTGSLKVYHRSGDEFWFRAKDQDAISRVVDRVNNELKDAVFTAESPDGTIHEKRGVGLSHGTGSDTKSAEADAKTGEHPGSKQSRKAAGLRSGSRDLPERVGEEPAQGQQVGEREAAREEVAQPQKFHESEIAPIYDQIYSGSVDIEAIESLKDNPKAPPKVRAAARYVYEAVIDSGMPIDDAMRLNGTDELAKALGGKFDKIINSQTPPRAPASTVTPGVQPNTAAESRPGSEGRSAENPARGAGNDRSTSQTNPVKGDTVTLKGGQVGTARYVDPQMGVIRIALPQGGTKTFPLRDVVSFGNREGERGAARLLDIPSAAKDAVKNYLIRRSERNYYTEQARHLEGGIYDLDRKYEANVLDAMDLLKQARTKFNAADQEAVYHASENQAEGRALTANQQTLRDDYIKPLQADNQSLHDELTGMGWGSVLPFENDDYIHRVAEGKGGRLDSAMAGGRAGKGNILGRKANSLNSRTMFAAEDADGHRIVVHQGDGELTGFEGGRTFTLAKPGSALKPGDQFRSTDGQQLTLKQATTREIEDATDVRYHKNALAVTVDDNLQLNRALNAARFLEDFKQRPEFSTIAMKPEKGQRAPQGWQMSPIPQFQGYAFEPRTWEVLKDLYDRMHKTQGPGVMEKIGDFLQTSVLLNPVMHAGNMADIWLTERGALKNAQIWKGDSAVRAGMKAIRAVMERNDDYRDALRNGAPLMSHRAVVKDVNSLLFRTLTDTAAKDPGMLTKLREFMGIAKDDKNPIDAVRQASHMMAFMSNDVFYLQSLYEKMDSGMSQQQAVRATNKIFPEYRVPTRVLDSKAFADFLKNRMMTWFSGYHYGRWRAYRNMVVDGLGPNVDGATRTRILSSMAMLGLMVSVGYPLYDKFWKKVSGDENARSKRFGLSGLPSDLLDVHQGKKPVSSLIESQVTPSAIVRAGVETAINRDSFTGGRVYDPNAPVTDELRQIGKHIERNAVGPISQYNRFKNDPEGKGTQKFAYSQLGVSFPKYETESPAQIMLHNILRENMPPLTVEQQQDLDARKARIAGGDLTQRERKNAIKKLAEGEFRYYLEHPSLTVKDVERVYKAATPEEQSIIGPILVMKAGRKARSVSTPQAEREEDLRVIREYAK